jgi:hypothetical protein
MRLKRRKLNLILIITAVLLAIGILVVYIIGERKLTQNEKKSYSGAKEVMNTIITNRD